MFQFSAFALHPYAFRVKYPCGWVAPFGNPRITALLPAPLGLSQVYASFIASRHQDIHHVPLSLGHTNRTPRPLRPSLALRARRSHRSIGSPCRPLRRGPTSRPPSEWPRQHISPCALHSTFNFALQLASPALEDHHRAQASPPSPRGSFGSALPGRKPGGGVHSSVSGCQRSSSEGRPSGPRTPLRLVAGLVGGSLDPPLFQSSQPRILLSLASEPPVFQGVMPNRSPIGDDLLKPLGGAAVDSPTNPRLPTQPPPPPPPPPAPPPPGRRSGGGGTLGLGTAGLSDSTGLATGLPWLSPAFADSNTRL